MVAQDVSPVGMGQGLGRAPPLRPVRDPRTDRTRPGAAPVMDPVLRRAGWERGQNIWQGLGMPQSAEHSPLAWAGAAAAPAATPMLMAPITNARAMRFMGVFLPVW